jgi:putative flippase GtrA
VAPEAVAFAVIGAGNSVLYFALFNVLLSIGAVKANVIATLLTTTLSYFANRHWTYRGRPKSRKRVEYSMFFGFNLAGMLIQAGTVGGFKYGLGLSESKDRMLLNGATLIGVALATLFRFWTYRTLVFRPHPTDHAAPTGAPEAIAEAIETDHERAEFAQLTGPLEEELDDERPVPQSGRGVGT